jgi:hypothetical protein
MDQDWRTSAVEAGGIPFGSGTPPAAGGVQPPVNFTEGTPADEVIAVRDSARILADFGAPGAGAVEEAADDELNTRLRDQLRGQ